jgi:hypothetical protein
MAQHYRRKQIRQNLLEMYRENATRSQSYTDVLRLEHYMGVITEVQLRQVKESVYDPKSQLNLFDWLPGLAEPVLLLHVHYAQTCEPGSDQEDRRACGGIHWSRRRNYDVLGR